MNPQVLAGHCPVCLSARYGHDHVCPIGSKQKCHVHLLRSSQREGGLLSFSFFLIIKCRWITWTLQTYWPVRGSMCEDGQTGPWFLWNRHTNLAIPASRVHFMREHTYLFQSFLFEVLCYAPDIPTWESKLITQSRISKTKFCAIYMYTALLPKSKYIPSPTLFLYIKWIHGSCQQNRPQ